MSSDPFLWYLEIYEQQVTPPYLYQHYCQSQTSSHPQHFERSFPHLRSCLQPSTQYRSGSYQYQVVSINFPSFLPSNEAKLVFLYLLVQYEPYFLTHAGSLSSKLYQVHLSQSHESFLKLCSVILQLPKRKRYSSLVHLSLVTQCADFSFDSLALHYPFPDRTLTHLSLRIDPSLRINPSL